MYCVWRICRKRTCVPEMVVKFRSGHTREDSEHLGRPLVVDDTD